LYEFKATRNTEREKKKGKNRIGASRASLHAKFFGFDERFMFIGSFNLDGRSTSLNSELGAYFESPEYATELSRIFSEDVPLIAYRLKLDEEGDIFWISRSEDGSEVSVDKEPDTTGWKRFSTRVLSWIVPESQL
jgi:putative cardiolipin synthase